MNPKDLWFITKDAISILRGQGYFHVKQGIGAHWDDPRCYYNDLRPKANWEGRRQGRIPLLHIPRLGGDIIFPIMVLQYALGCLDLYFTTGRDSILNDVDAVHEWLVDQLTDSDMLDNRFPDMDPGSEYSSANSAMAQGQVLSLCSRLIKYLPERYDANILRAIMHRVYTNMLLPVSVGGTVRTGITGPMYCETCRGDGHVVYNGWIFALFGLYDYAQIEPKAKVSFTTSEAAFAAKVADMVLNDGWSVYDTDGTISSPFYQHLHGALVEAMSRLVKREEYTKVSSRLLMGDRRQVRWRRTFAKGVDKLRQNRMYTGES